MTKRDIGFRVQGSGERSSFFVLRSLLRGANTPDVATRNASRRGLTLIELLTSFAILTIIVALLGVTLNTATDTWHSTQARTRVVTQARAVMNTIAQNLRQAVATTNFPITITDDPATYGATNNAIQFLRLLPSAAGTNQYALRAIRYGVTNTSLVCWTQTLDTAASGSLPGSWDDDHLALASQTPLTLADGLANLRFSPAGTNSIIVQAGIPVPPYIDVYLELLGDDDSRTAAGLAGAAQLQFVERHVLRFSQRVYLPAVNRWNLP